MCKYGKGCKFAHIKVGANGTSSNGTQGSDWRAERQNSGAEKFSMSNLTKSDNDFMSGSSISTAPKRVPGDLYDVLSQDEAIPHGQIPVNQDHQRLGPYQASISSQEQYAFKARVAIQKLCNSFHLTGRCKSGDDCPYDHRAASLAEIKCLKHVNRNNPCQRKGACRNLQCLNGHICQKSDCKYSGGSTFCKLPPAVHNEDLNLAGYEPALMPKDSIKNNDNIDDTDTFESASTKSAGGTRTTTPLKELGRSTSDVRIADESAGGLDGQGALVDIDDMWIRSPEFRFIRLSSRAPVAST